MLCELHIENLGVIERAALVFDHGVTVLTGETGAGKTMLVEAIELLVGGRADPSIVRVGATEARIDGRIVLDRGDSESTELVLTRVIPADGRSRAYVDGRPATASRLAELTTGIIDLHGQHAHQGLLSTVQQRAALDAFGAVDLEPLRRARAHLTELDAELATLGGDERARARELDLVRFQVDELDAARIEDPAEDERHAREEALLADAVAHRERALAALDALRGDGGAGDAIAAALRELGRAAPFDDLVERLEGLSAELDETATLLRSRSETIEEDPRRLHEIRERRQFLAELRRKYGSDLAEVLAFHTQASDRLRELEGYDLRAAEIDAERAAALARERAAAEAIGRRRREVAPLLAAQVEERLRGLAMPDVTLAIEVGRDADDHPGDDVRFLLGANPGSPLLPLHKVASGGELARAMLALRLVLLGAGDSGAASTLVFDEVDAGVGGAAAAAVGRALADLVPDHQVLIVTHLAQVAAPAHHQFVVTKTAHDGVTTASVSPVSGDARIGEIARMLAGSDTSTAREHARDLLDRF